jgi:XRE family transcriptional regulator, fatty acid utilization regulator
MQLFIAKFKLQDKHSGMDDSTDFLEFPHLARRVTVAREHAGLTQDKLSKRLGFKDRQTLAAIEAGQRKVVVDELLALIRVTGKDMEFFTDPFRLVGEAEFSYRASGVSDIEVDQFEGKVGEWLALWRYLGEKRGETPGPLHQRLAINERSTFEEARYAGEQVAQKLKLGAIAAERLSEAIQTYFGILVLSVDMPEGVSGAAVQLTSGDAILINRQEAPGRRVFDLAHELFHILTWDAIPPARVDRENPSSYKAKRTEQLADNFAGALLIPSEDISRRWKDRSHEVNVKDWFLNVSGHYGVSASALFWRMVALAIVKKEEAERALAPSSIKARHGAPPLFSRRFLERVIGGIEHGEVSVRRVLKLLDLDLEDFRSQCAAHGVPVKIGL